MKTYIVLLKGINVGGHKKVPMADLRELLTKEGFEDVKTYIQSGNVILKTKETDVHTLENHIQEAIKAQFGFDVSVLIKSRDQLQTIFNRSPFPQPNKEKSYFFMLHDKPSKELVDVASEKSYDDEEYHIIEDCIYYFSKKGMGKAKFNGNFFERKLNTFATARNYNTMVKLLSLSQENE